MLKKILIDLREGKTLPLNWTVNQYGNEIPYEELKFRDGKWYLERINCASSSQYGLGICNCFNHPAVVDEEVTRKEAMQLIRDYVAEIEANQKAREEEIRFLDGLIASL